MVTEAFILTYNDTEKAYLDIDRTYKYGGIMLLSDSLDKIGIGIDGCTYFNEFNLNNWLKSLNVTDAIITLAVNKNCDGNINSNVYKNKIDDILTIIVKNSVVLEIKTSDNHTIYTKNDDYMKEYYIGWFGKVFDYYTNFITNEINNCTSDDDYYNDIWGVSYILYEN